MCQVSPDIANHDDSKMKGDRSVLNEMNLVICVCLKMYISNNNKLYLPIFAKRLYTV